MPDRVLVTGVSGFLGGHVALQLLAAGYIVRGSVRDPARADGVRATLARHGADIGRLEFATLDLLRDAGWAQAMEGARYLQHVASPFVIKVPRDRSELVRPAVEGTTRALEAAFASGVERVVLTSSMAAIMYGHARRDTPFTATDWTIPGPGVNAYLESKTLAEKAAWAIAARHGRIADLVSVNPANIYGPLLDDDPGTSAGMVLRLLDGSLPAVAKIHLLSIDVRDVATLLVKAMTEPTAGGHRFPAAAGNISLLEMASALRGAFPAYAGKLPRFAVPDWLVRLAAFADADLRGNIAELGPPRQLDASAARTLLGRPFIPPADAVIESARSGVDHKLV